MRSLIIGILALISTQALALPPTQDLVGSYTGCGHSSVLGARQVIFHLVEMPTGQSGPYATELSAAFTWKDAPSAIYFPTVSLVDHEDRLVMRTETQPPLRDFGLIINTLTIDVRADGSMQGHHQTNSMTSDGQLLSGTWQATRLADGAPVPVLNCRP